MSSSPSPSHSSGSAPPLPARVLVIDDEEAVGTLVQRLLAARGYDVIIATDALAGLKALSGGGTDVIMVDLAMPRLDGLQVIKLVRELDLHVPVILMTDLPSIETVMKAINQGAFRYLTKPLNPEEMLTAVARAVVAHKLSILKRQAAALVGREPPGLLESFERALKGLWIAYQPIVRSCDGSVFGYEALMRLEEPGLPHPGAMLSAAEKLGRTADLGRVVRERAPAAATPDGAALFVNLHPEDLLDEQLFEAGAPLGLVASTTVLEITERATLRDLHKLPERLARLRKLGYRIAVDDLGAGYAGLTSFADLEPEFVKLDMSLTRDVDKDPMRQRIVRSMAALCKEVGAQVVAEGIERAEERDVVTELGCDLIQGYFVARPGRPFPKVNW
ncbi:MAG: EAL domain-containing protein [Deltaproteobacteria bacterium]|nr:EAL domain-containing protein [Deltaproteobacteria bacterium]